MVRLYKDPDGTTVFTTNENTMLVTMSTVAAVRGMHHLLDGENNCLRKRVKELENALAAYKVITHIRLMLFYRYIFFYLISRNLLEST